MLTNDNLYWQRTSTIKIISYTGILISVFLVFDIFSIFFKFLPGGYSPNIKLIWYILVLTFTKKIKIKILFFFLSPMFDLLLGFHEVHVLQVLMEYFLSFWVFFPFIFFKNFCQNFFKNRIIVYSLFFSMLFICYIANFLCYYIAGYLWWTPHDSSGSFILNIQYVGISAAIDVPIITVCFNIFYKSGGFIFI